MVHCYNCPLAVRAALTLLVPSGLSLRAGLLLPGASSLCAGVSAAGVFGCVASTSPGGGARLERATASRGGAPRSAPAGGASSLLPPPLRGNPSSRCYGGLSSSSGLATPASSFSVRRYKRHCARSGARRTSSRRVLAAASLRHPRVPPGGRDSLLSAILGCHPGGATLFAGFLLSAPLAPPRPFGCPPRVARRARGRRPRGAGPLCPSAARAPRAPRHPPVRRDPPIPIRGVVGVWLLWALALDSPGVPHPPLGWVYASTLSCLSRQLILSHISIRITCPVLPPERAQAICRRHLPRGGVERLAIDYLYLADQCKPKAL